MLSYFWHFARYWSIGSLEFVKGRTFKNRRVRLDRRHFVGCHFEGVVFVWDGGPCIVGTGCTFADPVYLESLSPVISDAIEVLGSLQMLAPRVTPNPGYESHTVAMRR